MNGNSASRHPARRPNRGSVLVAALVALSVVMSLLATMLLVAVRARRQLGRERNLRQCELLLRAGMDRAARQLARSDEYRGETWQIAGGALPVGEAHVTIAVEPLARGESRQLEITAEYPLGDEWSVQRSFTGSFQARSSPFEEK